MDGSGKVLLLPRVADRSASVRPRLSPGQGTADHAGADLRRPPRAERSSANHLNRFSPLFPAFQEEFAECILASA